MKKYIPWILVIVVLILLGVLTLRILSPEDTWICDHGQRVAHGKPDAMMPSEACPGVATS